MAATHLRCGGISDDEFTANVLLNFAVKEFSKLVSTRPTHGQQCSGVFSTYRVTNGAVSAPPSIANQRKTTRFTIYSK